MSCASVPTRSGVNPFDSRDESSSFDAVQSFNSNQRFYEAYERLKTIDCHQMSDEDSQRYWELHQVAYNGLFQPIQALWERAQFDQAREVINGLPGPLKAGALYQHIKKMKQQNQLPLPEIQKIYENEKPNMEPIHQRFLQELLKLENVYGLRELFQED